MKMLTRQEMLMISKFVIKARETIRDLDALLAEGKKQTLRNRNSTLMRGMTFVNQTERRYERYVKRLKKGEHPEKFLEQTSECTDKISRVLRGEGVEGMKFYAVVPGEAPIGPYSTKTDAVLALKSFRREWYLEHRAHILF